METNTLKKKTVSGVFWRFGERILAQGVSFLVSLILARILMPEEFGAISLITVFITIANIFIADGFCAALIQKKDANSLDYTTVLIGSFGIALFLYLLCYLLAPAVASFYHIPVLNPALRVLALRLPIAAINSVQIAYLSKKMQFKKFFWATLGGTVGSAAVGIWMAIKGFGIFALVGQNLFNYTIDTVILFFVIKRFPKLKFSFQRMKSLFSFGYRILLTNLLFTFTDQIRTLVIGKFYTSSNLAFYSKGKQFPELISTNITQPLSSVLFPAISSVQNDIAQVRSFLRKSTQLISYLVSPLLLGLATVSHHAILLLLTEKWLPCVPFVWYFCIYYLLPPIHSVNLEAVKAIGRSDQVLKFGIIKRIVSMTTLICSVWFGAEAIALGMIASAVIATFINAYQNKRLFFYSYKDQYLDLIPNIFYASIANAIGYFVGMFLALPPVASIFIQILVTMLIYMLLSIVTRNLSFRYVLGMLRKEK